MRRDTVGRDHFEALYAARPDPWRLATSDYERDKYAATLAALPRPRYARGFELGCAMGILTGQLGRRCDGLLAVEPVASALSEARARNADQPHIRFAPLFAPGAAGATWGTHMLDINLVQGNMLDLIGRQTAAWLARR